MIQLLAAMFGIVSVFLVPVAGVVLLLCDRKLRQRISTAERRNVRRILMVSGWSLALAGVLGIIGTAAAGVSESWAGEFDLADFVACGVAVMLSVVVLAGGRVALQAARSLGEQRPGSDGTLLNADSPSRAGTPPGGRSDEFAGTGGPMVQPPTQTGKAGRPSSMLSAVGWLLTLLPLVYFSPAVFLTMIVPICIATVVLLVLTVRRRSDEANLLWVMAIAAENQMSLPDELDIYALTLRRRKRVRVQQLVGRLRSGIPLSEALCEFPGLIPRSATLAVQVAEPLGSAARTLRDAAVRHTASIRNPTTASSVAWFAVYYSLVVTVVWGMFTFQMTWIAPKLLRIFEDFDADLPDVTVHTIRTINLGAENALLLAPLAAMPVAVLVVLGVGYYRGWGNLKLPLIGKYLTRNDTPLILRNLAQTVSSGQPLQAGLEPMARHFHRPEVGQRLACVVQGVAQGDDCWELLRVARLIRPQEATLLSAAARARNLPWALNELADEIERRQRLRVLAAFEFIRPILVIAVGVAVAVYCLAWFLPIVHLIQSHSAL